MSKKQNSSTKIKVRARQAVRYGGRRYLTGNTFQCDTDTASRLMRRDVVEISREAVSPGEAVPSSAHSLLPNRAPSGEHPGDVAASTNDALAEEGEGKIPGIEE